jgi:uncharacterized membrane protein YoaT (DUF817 family)
MLRHVDAALLRATRTSPLARHLPHPLAELAFFALKQARACLFAAVIFLSVFVVPRGGIWHVPRYDVLLAIALVTQAGMLWRRIETWDEAKTIALFHVCGFALEVFKVSPGIASWSYPEAAWSKVFGVPLFSGFMYASVGSYVMQSWRMLEQRIERHPPYWMTGLLAAAMYLNLFTHHFLPDLRWYLAAVALGLYARCMVVFKPLDRERRMPLLLGFVLVGFFIWLAENFGTFFGIWRYPNQFGAWATVALGKWSSWAMLTLLSFTLVTNLKHVKARIHLAP